MTTDDKAGMAAFADKERWRKFRKIEDQRLRNDTSTSDQRFDLMASMARFARGLRPDLVEDHHIRPHKLRLAKMLNGVR